MIHIFRLLFTFMLLVLSIPIILGFWFVALTFWEGPYFDKGANIIEMIIGGD